MDRFDAMQKQLFCKLNAIEEKFDGMVQALGFVRSVVPEEANHFCGDLIIGGNSQQHMNQPLTGMPIYGRGGNNANCDSYSPAIRNLFGQFINHNTIVEEEANIRRHEGYEEVCCNDTIITTNTDTTTTIIKSCQPKHYQNNPLPQPYYNNYNNNYSNFNNNRYESSPPYYNFRSYNYKNKRRNGYSPNNRQSKFLGNSSTRSSTPNNFGDNNNSNSIIINPNNDKRGTFGASSRQRKKASTAQANKEGKGGDAGKEIQEKKGKQVINEKEDVLKKLREWTTRSALLSYTASEDEYDDTTEDDGKTEIKLNESDKVENWRDRSKVVKEKEAYKYPKARSTKNGTAGQNEKGRKKKMEEGIEGNWRKSVKSYNEVLNEAKEKKKEKPKKKSKSLVDFNTKWSLFYS